MMSSHIKPIDRQQFEIEQLMAEHRPSWRDANKRTVYEIACPPGSVHAGQLEYSRWGAMPLPEHVDLRSIETIVVNRSGYYDYHPASDRADNMEWHVNFADPKLFVAYESPLFAQDEMQVAEHPVLGALRDSLLARNLDAVTVENDVPTPVLVVGAPRRCCVATDANAADGRPFGLYGNSFSCADPGTVRRATKRIDPPTITNLIAMAAPSYGLGLYRTDEVEHVLVTAYSAFRAAMLESARSLGSGRWVVVHTGFWGCGAFGGNRVLMTILQLVASRMAGLDQIVFHTGESAGTAAFDAALRMMESERIGGGPLEVRKLIHRIVALGFEWGVSDGN